MECGEWLDWNPLIGGGIIVWYWDDNYELKALIWH